MTDRTEYQANYHAKNPEAATNRKQNERERMRVAVFYAKLFLLHGRIMPEFVDGKLVKPALASARKELNLQNVTTVDYQ